jgi:hypothetical protein
MAVVVRRSVSRRVPYAALRERWWETELPWDDAAERLAIGAVLLAPNDWSKKLSVRLYSGHFYDRGHGWLWEQIAMCKGHPTDDWYQKIQPAFRERFLGSAARELGACVTGCFWYHGKWYTDRVIKAAKLRARIMSAAESLTTALAASEAWRRT